MQKFYLEDPGLDTGKMTAQRYGVPFGLVTTQALLISHGAKL